MKDLHAHLLYGIDDGCETIEEAIQLLKEMEESGVTDVILTPHYVEKTKYSCNNQEKKILFDQLKEKAGNEGLTIRLYLGNEVFFTENFIELLKNNEIRTLNNSKYLLFEFPMANIYRDSLEILQELITTGCVPILAHPERYYLFQKYPDAIKEFLQAGIHLQGNFTSLFGKYGKEAKKTLEYFIEKHWISFLGSDCHHDVSYDRKGIEKKLLQLTKDEEYVKDLLENNFEKVIHDEDMAIVS